MIEGLWVVQYEGVNGGDGGVIVFVKGQVLGGDNAFVYSGHYQVEGDVVQAHVSVRNFAPGIGNVLGVQGDFELAVHGTIFRDVIKGSATLVGQQGAGMVVKLTKAENLLP